MRGLSAGTELLKFVKNGDWYDAQLAIDGTPSIEFSIPIPDIMALPSEEAVMTFLEQQARNMISAYGDARSPRQDAFLEYCAEA